MAYLKLGNKHIGFTQFYIIDCVSKTAITKTHIYFSVLREVVNQNTFFVLIAAMLLTAAVASALYVNSVSAQMSNSTSGKNMTNTTMAGNMTKKTANMTSGAFNTTNKAK
ncbi:MAG: hypothetical protein M3044_12950 [Thermoproteota archaeon]|nr:hypothetical protein [Thermoproteota archaeon]